MEYVRAEHIVTDTLDYPDGKIFVVYRKYDEKWAFGMKIGKTYTKTQYMDQRVDRQGIEKAYKKVLYAKNYGWSYTGTKEVNPEFDDYDNPDPVFMCMYCKNTTFDISQPCKCRNKTTQDFVKKTPSGFILPF